jgi:hypothetical protein
MEARVPMAIGNQLAQQTLGGHLFHHFADRLRGLPGGEDELRQRGRFVLTASQNLLLQCENRLPRSPHW